MKILINISGVKFGGTFTDSYNILKELASLGKNDEYYIFISKRAKKQLPELPNNFYLKTFPLAEKCWPIRFVADQIFIPFFVLFKKINVTLGFNFTSFLAPCYQIIRIAQPACFSPLVSNKTTTLGYKGRMLVYRQLILMSIQRANKIIFLSQALKEDIARFINLRRKDDKYLVSYNGIDQRFRTVVKSSGPLSHPLLKKQSVKILYPAFWYFHKDFYTLFKSVPLVAKRLGLELQLLITVRMEDLSDQEKEYINSEIIAKGLRDNIVFLGEVPYEQIVSLYMISEAIVFPSFCEACPNPLPEAMFLGKPIIASDLEVHKEICDEAALYFKVFDPQDLADKIILLLKDRDRQQKLKLKGIERAKDFSWRRHVSLIYRLIEESKK